MIDHDSFFDWLIKALLAAAFGSWAWVVRHFGMQHVDSITKLTTVLDKYSDRLTEVEKNLARIEGKCSTYHHAREEE